MRTITLFSGLRSNVMTVFAKLILFLVLMAPSMSLFYLSIFQGLTFGIGEVVIAALFFSVIFMIRG